ncbi:MAG: hypothetical protein ACRD2N_20975 [Vicinamibacterales bacterium]
MNCLRKAVVLSLLFSPLLGGSAEAMVKCRATPGGVPIRNTTPLFVVDGKVMGDVPKAPRDDSTRIAGIKLDEILSVTVVCLEMMEAGVRVGRNAIAVITKAGAVSFMRSHLQALMHEQEAYRARTGNYARDLTTLGFFATRAPLPIEMHLKEGGWSAKAELGVFAACQVVVESAPTGGSAPTVACDHG